MLTERQKKLLNFLVKEYICTAGPVSSKALKKVCRVYFKQSIFLKNGGDNNTSKGFLIPLTRLLNDIANNKQNDI